MKNSGRQKFEELWQEAFEGSETSPSDSVWSNIELKLDNEKMKRRVIYYQRLAAASVLFALLVGIGGVRYWNRDSSGHLALEQRSDQAEKSTTTTNKRNSEEERIKHELKSTNESSDPLIEKQEDHELLKEVKPGVDNQHHPGIQQKDNTIKQLQITTGIRSIAALTSPEDELAKAREERLISETDPLSESLLFYSPLRLSQNKLPEVASDKKEEKKTDSPHTTSVLSAEQYHEKQAEEKKENAESLWIAFGAAGGSYNPGSATPSSQALNSSLASRNSFTNLTAPQSSRSSAGSAYSIGFSVGRKVADRWVVQTGVNYLNQIINYTSNFATQSTGNANQLKASQADYAAQSTAPVTITQPYKINSNMEFVSIPAQVGYLIIDRKIGLQLNAGVASDIFLRNTLQDQSGQSRKYSQSSGAESPYRSLNWAGLASTELSYRMSKQYRISLMPGFRYSLQPALKSQSGTSSNPLVLDIGFRFRYIFQ